MKRILSLTLALVMVLGTFTGVFAAEPTVEEAAGKFLETKGILLGDDNGNLMLKDNLERRDAVILLSRLLGVEEVAAEFPTSEESPSWTDVRTDAYYVPFFAWAEANGYFEGNEDNTFAPRAAISAPEYALVLLRALGYEVNGHESWKAALETAKEVGLLEDVEVKFEDKVVRGQMAVMTLNALKANIEGTDETLAEKLGIELPEAPKAKELTAEVNDTENLMEVVVELSNAELADALKLENTSNYTLSGGRTIKSATIVEDDVVLLLENALVRNREYTLTIKNIDRAINTDYKFKARDNAVPTIESVEVLGEYGIKVTASEPVEKPLERNILIDGRRESVVVEQYGRNTIIRPYGNRSFSTNVKTLEIIELEDYAGYRSTSEKSDIEIVKDEVAPEIVSSKMAGKIVTVEFDKDIYEPSVEAYDSTRDLGNASYTERRITFYADKARKVDTNKVEYEFKEELPRNLELTVEGVQNHSKITMERTKISPVLVADDSTASVVDNKRKTISLSSDVDSEVYKDGKVYGHAVELTIEFDKNIKASSINPAENYKNNFIVYEKDVNSRGQRAAERVDINLKEVDGKKVVLELTNLIINNSDKDYDYVLEVKNLEDTSGNRIFRDFVDFELVTASKKFNIATKDNGDKKITINEFRNNIEITITFTHALDRDGALDPKNYYFANEKDLDQLDGYVIVTNGDKDVTLVIPVDRDEQDKFFEDYPTLEILRRVTRSNGDRLDPNDNVITLSEYR